MLETLVSSRIRRSLFEYLLSHPQDRFYLRGLAKELGLSVSPLRRELKRLEHVGMLRSVQEANLLYYSVNADSPTFLQLQHAGQQTEAPSTSLETQRTSAEAQVTVSDTLSPQPVVASPSVVTLGSAVPARELRRAWTQSLPGPALVAAAAVGMALALVMASLVYLTVTNQRLMSQASRVVTTRKTEVTMVTPPSASGMMRGARWQIVPGGFGGFSSTNKSSEESY